MSNVGKWDEWYKQLKKVEPYGNSLSYIWGADFLEDCDLVEDWGCGKGWFRLFRKTNYVGIDGSKSRYADKIADLETYTSEADGIFLRHVLEHNYNWQPILDNALKSAQKKLFLAIFTPLQDKTQVLTTIPGVDVPDMGFKLEDITDRIPDTFKYAYETIKSEETFYNEETIFWIEKK